MLSSKNQITSITDFPQQIPFNEQKIEESKLNSFISTDSNNDTNINTKKYIFENDKKSYTIFLILFEEKIKIKVNPKDFQEYYYEKDFSLEDLKRINNIFKICNNIEEPFTYFNELFQENQNEITISENNENNTFQIEKNLKVSSPLKIEIPKIFRNNNNNHKEIKKISPLNDNNCDIKLKLEELENANADLFEKFKKKYLENEENLYKLSQNLNLIDNYMNNINIKNTGNKKNLYSLLNKKRGSTSNLSEISFNSNNSNDNLINNKKNKNNLEKETFLKIFSDNNSVNSGDSKDKFFMKILKQKKMEEENNNLEKNKNINIDNIIENKKNEEENGEYLYGEEDSSDEIKDDIDFFSNYSPSQTPNNNNIINKNDSDLNLNKNEKNQSQSSFFNKEKIFNNNKLLFHENNNDLNNINIYQEKNKNIIEQNKNGPYWEVYNSNNFIGGGLERDSNKRKKNSNTSYKIINKNYIECCNVESSYFQGKNQYSNKMFSLDSKIIQNYSQFDFIINYLKNKCSKEIINSIKIYRATEDGDKAEDFHKQCDGNTNIIILIKTKNGKKFGGYSSIGFSNYNKSVLDDTAFIFSIDKREIYPNIKGKNAIDSYQNLGPTFSGDMIKIYDNFLQKGGITAKIGTNYQTIEDYQINDGNRSFSVEEVEVFEFLEMKIDNNI